MGRGDIAKGRREALGGPIIGNTRNANWIAAMLQSKFGAGKVIWGGYQRFMTYGALGYPPSSNSTPTTEQD
jgi:hypothetical protein